MPARKRHAPSHNAVNGDAVRPPPNAARPNPAHQDGAGALRELSPLRASIRESLRRYFQSLADEEISGVYRMALDEVEPPLLAAVMEHAGGNLSQAARILGLHRSTLCNKLRRHGLRP